ncbi:MAG: type II secretion system secretin GspD [Desulfobacteraceae bacterium]
MKPIIRPFLTAIILTAIIFHPAFDGPAMAQSATGKNEQLVSIDFNNVDLVVFIKFMSDLTKKNFIIDDKVRGKVTIISPGKITVKEAYRVFLSVLEVHGYAAVEAGKITKIVPSPEARSKSIKTRLEEESGMVGDNVVTQLIPLRYADPDEIKRLFTPMVSKSSVILSYKPTSTLIITDVQSNISRLMRILKAIDITGVGQQIAIIPVEYADAGKLVTLLSSIFKKGSAKGAAAKDITFVADERTNSIVLLASEGDTDNIRRLIKSLDKKTPKGQAKIHVYYLEHANAEDLAKVLLNIPKKDTSEKKTGKKTAPVVSTGVSISADAATNSLIIMADMEDYVVLESIIKKIDIPRAMVYIEALIMEVNVTKDFRLGTEYIIGGETGYEDKDILYGGGFSAGDTSGTAGTLGTAANNLGVALAPGFSVGLFGETIEVGGYTFPSISAVVQAYKEDSDVNILSTPQILTTDNQEAKIYVGSNVPFQTTTTNSDSGTTLYNSYEYRDVGKTLQITPHISKDRMVRLELSLEISSIAGTQTTTPTTLKRTVETTAIVRDNNTVVLGGLIDDQMDTTVYKIPCLGDIPLLKYLFRKSSNSNDKTNLYIFLTPRVIQNPDEAGAVSKGKRDQIEKLREENIKLYNKSGKTKSADDPMKPGVESMKYKETESPLARWTPPPKEAAVKESGISDGDPSTGASSYTIEVASLPTAQQADRMLEKLIGRGYAAYTVKSDVADQTEYRVRIGFFDNERSSREVMKALKSDQYEPTLIEF